MMLDVQGLRTGYGRIPILNGVSFSVNEGEFIGILGHNGMGKTTLLKALMGFLPTVDGNLRLSLNEWLRAIAGTFVLLSLALGWFVHPGFFLFTAFVGANLLQSAFSKTCPMMAVLRRLGVREPGTAK